MACHPARMLFVCGIVLILVHPLPCHGVVIEPDGSGDYPTIQDALDAGEWDIALADGIFTGEGNRELATDMIHLYSLSGDPETCVLDLEGYALGGGAYGPIEFEAIGFRNGSRFSYG